MDEQEDSWQVGERERGCGALWTSDDGETQPDQGIVIGTLYVCLCVCVCLHHHCRHIYLFKYNTSVQSNLADGRITDLSPLAAANGFVRSWLPVNTWFLGPTRAQSRRALHCRWAVTHFSSCWAQCTVTFVTNTVATKIEMKHSLPNANTQRTVTSGVTTWLVFPATHTFIHEWNEPSCMRFVSIHQMASPEQGGTHLDQLTTHLSTFEGWKAELA